MVEDHYDDHHGHEEETPAPVAKSLVPTSDPTLVIDDDLKAVFNALYQRTKLGHRPKALSLAQQAAEILLGTGIRSPYRTALFEFSVPNIRESRDWFGSKGIGDDNRPKWFESLFVRAIRTEVRSSYWMR